MADDLQATIAELMPGIQSDLERLVRIPSIAFPGYDPEPVHRSAEATAEILEAAGLRGVRLIELPDVDHPAVFGEVLAPPAVSDGNVYVSAIDLDSQRGQLLALDVGTGRKEWEFSPQVGVTTVSGPSAGDGSVVAGFADRMVRSFVADGGEERSRPSCRHEGGQPYLASSTDTQSFSSGD